MKLCVLASGSKGNSLVVQSAGGTQLMIDCGLSCRELVTRARARGFDPGASAGILFTHDHSDHYAALEILHRHYPAVPLFANGDTAEAIGSKTGVSDGWNAFETAMPFAVGDVTITPFATSHDAVDPVGYLLSDGHATFLLGTDTGYATLGLKDALAQADVAVLESNHDPILLATSDRSPSLKQRIASRSGHLSNEDAAALVRTVNPPHLKTLLLAHLSQECNSVSLARAAMQQALDELGRADVTLGILSQDEPDIIRTF